MLSNLKTLFDSIKSGLSFSQRRTVLQSDASSSQSEQKYGSDDFISNRHSDSGERFSISRWDSLEGLEEVGRGAFGVVYRAWDPVLRRYVALKLFRADEGQIEEARKLAQVNSPNIVKIFRFETHEGYPGFTMEFIEGLTLADEIEQGAPLDCKAAAAIGIDLCKAVSAVHSAGLLHRDIKAQNVMREASGRIVLMDFGLGENMNNPDVGDSLSGTLPYMAPELFVGGRASVSTDVYSLGVLLYFLVSGEYPVSANGISGFRKAHVNGPRVSLRKYHRSINRGFARIVERATTADPRRRFSSAEQLAQALVRWRAKRLRNQVLVTAAAVTVLVAAAMVAAVYAMRTPAIRQYRLDKITKVSGVSMEPSISADGQFVAYESDTVNPRYAPTRANQQARGNFAIWVEKVDDEGIAPRRVTDDPAHDTEPTLSPDGKQVAYHSNRSGGGIYIRSIAGGPERLLSQFGHNPKFSPDGTKIVFWTGLAAHFAPPYGEIYLVPAAGGIPRRLAPEFIDARLPVWSTDGNEILFQGCPKGCQDPGIESDWWKISENGAEPVKTGALQDARDQGLTNYLGPVGWQHNNIVFSANMEHGTNLWQIAASKPFWVFPRRAFSLTTSTEGALDPSMSASGAIVFSGARSTVHMWRVPIGGAVEPEPLNENEEIDSMPSISADGSRVMYFRRIGNSRRMIVRPIESLDRELISTEVPQPTRGVISASGNLVAYSVLGKEGRQIYTGHVPFSSDDSKSPILTAKSAEVIDIFDNDQRLLIVTASGISSLEIKSHRQVLLLPNRDSTADHSQVSTFDQAQVSPNGKSIAFLGIQDAEHSQIYVAPMGSGPIPEGQWKPITTQHTWYDKPRWTKDGRSIVFLSKQDDFLCIWKQDLDTDMHARGSPQEILHMPKAHFSPMYLSRIAFNLSVANDVIVFNAVDMASNIWMAR